MLLKKTPRLKRSADDRTPAPAWWRRPRLTLTLNLIFVAVAVGLLALSQADSFEFFASPAAEKADEETSLKALDTLSSSDIAQALAELGEFRERSWIEVQAYNNRISLTADVGGLPIVAKPAVVNSTIRTRGDIIAQYVVAEGDTVLSLANYFNVSGQQYSLEQRHPRQPAPAGRTIVIPPPGLNGIVHFVQSGDTYHALIDEYSFASRSLLNFNDLASVDDLPVGEFIFLPGASPATIQTLPGYIAKAVNSDDGVISPSEVISCHGCGPVEAGDFVGKLGNTGWSTGPHLHLGIVTYDGRIHDPWAFINQNRLTWPVVQEQRRVTQVYHSGHRGLDIGHREGADLVAIADGEIVYRGCLWEYSSIFSSFGVLIDHGNYYSIYVHNQAPDNPGLRPLQY